MFGCRRYKTPNRTLLLKQAVGFGNLVNFLQLQVNLPKFAVIDSPFVRGILGDLFPEVRLTDGNRKTLKPKHAVGHVCHYFWIVNPSFQCFMRIHCTYTISFKVDSTCTWCINMLPLFLSVYHVGLFCIYDSPQVEFPPPDFAMLIMSLKQEQFRNVQKEHSDPDNHRHNHLQYLAKTNFSLNMIRAAPEAWYSGRRKAWSRSVEPAHFLSFPDFKCHCSVLKPVCNSCG